MATPPSIHVSLHDVTKTFESRLGPIQALGPLDLERTQSMHALRPDPGR